MKIKRALLKDLALFIYVGLIYFAKAKSNKFAHNKEEHNDIRWFTARELLNPQYAIGEYVRYHAKHALEYFHSGKNIFNIDSRD